MLLMLVGAGLIYHELFTPYCLISWDCTVEVFVSIFAQKSLLVLILDSIFALYYVLHVSRSLGAGKTLIVFLIASLITVYTESLYLAIHESFKYHIVGCVFGGIVTTGILHLLNTYVSTRSDIYSIKRRSFTKQLVLFIMYFTLRTYLSLSSSYGKTVYPAYSMPVVFVFSLVTGLYVLRGKLPINTWLARIVLILVIAVSGLIAYPLVGPLQGVIAKYNDSKLIYSGKECEVYYTVLKGNIEGYEKFTTPQVVTLSPLEGEVSVGYERETVDTIERACKTIIYTIRTPSSYSTILNTVVSILIILGLVYPSVITVKNQALRIL